MRSGPRRELVVEGAHGIGALVVAGFEGAATTDDVVDDQEAADAEPIERELGVARVVLLVGVDEGEVVKAGKGGEDVEGATAVDGDAMRRSSSAH